MLMTAIRYGSAYGVMRESDNISGCNSEGDTLEEAYEMARDALGLMYTTYKDDLHREFPTPCDPS